MPNRNYIAGRSFEYQVMGRLKRAGYWVLRAAGSKGPVDIIAIKEGWPWLLIQCKRSKAFPSADSWNALYALAWNNAVPLLASRIPGDRRIQYRRLTGRRDKGQAAIELLKHYNPFGQGQLL